MYSALDYILVALSNARTISNLSFLFFTSDFCSQEYHSMREEVHVASVRRFASTKAFCGYSTSEKKQAL